jgi:hypothetical protein
VCGIKKSTTLEQQAKFDALEEGGRVTQKTRSIDVFTRVLVVYSRIPTSSAEGAPLARFRSSDSLEAAVLDHGSFL